MASEAFDLTGRSGIVTGGAGHLGSQYAQALLRHGAGVVIADIDAARAAELSDRLAAEHGTDRVAAIPCDAADEGSVEAMVAQAVARFGRLDWLVNNHSAPPQDPAAFFAPFEDYPLAEWRRVMGVNLDGMFLVAKAVGRQMVAQGEGGSIVQVSSIYGAMASDNRIYEGARFRGNAINNPAVYSASKAGVIGLTRWLATYWAPAGIRVNAIAPGGVYAGQNEAFVQRYAARVPMARMAAEHEMNGTVLYLLSDASSYVTGQLMLVDGGLSAW